jgi:hypothetical protein
MRQLLKKIPGVYPSYLRYLEARRSIRRHPSVIAWQLDYKRWLSLARMRQYHNRYVGERCFIVGNGPSLNKMDITPLRNEKAFILNRGYLLLDQVGTESTFLVSVNKHVIEQFGQELAQLPIPKFISWRSRQHIPFTTDMMYIRPSRDVKFSYNPAHVVFEGDTVTYVAMQLAFYLGFKQAILIGVDHNFATNCDPYKLVTTEESDANHFDPDYFGKGVAWQLPNLEGSEKAYAMAGKRFAADGREIIDATVGGKLTLFPKVDYADLF